MYGPRYKKLGVLQKEDLLKEIITGINSTLGITDEHSKFDKRIKNNEIER